MKNIIKNNWFKTLSLGILLIITWKIIDISSIFKFIRSVFSILLPFIFGAIIAFFTYRPVIKLEKLLLKSVKKLKRHQARVISVVFVYFALFTIISVILQFLIPALYKNIQEFAQNVPQHYSNIEKNLKNFEGYVNLNISGKIYEIFNKYLSLDFVSKFVGIISNIANSILNVFLGIILSMYMLIERESLADLFKTLVGFVYKGKKHPAFATYAKKLVDIFNSYFVSLMLDAVVIGSISALFFLFFHAPYPWLLGVIIAIGNMIPFFGPIVAAVVVFLVCFIAMNPISALWALIFQIIAGQIDSNFIQPRLVGSSVGISPLWVIFAVTFFGGIFGPVGMIIGVPVVASIRLLYIDYKTDGKLDGNI